MSEDIVDDYDPAPEFHESTHVTSQALVADRWGRLWHLDPSNGYIRRARVIVYETSNSPVQSSA